MTNSHDDQMSDCEDNIHRDGWGNVLTDMAPIQQDVKFGKNVRLGIGVIIEEGCEIGDNCFIGHYAVIRPDVTIGNNSEVRAFCFIAEDVKISSGVRIFQYTNLGKGTIVEDQVWIGARTVTSNTNNIAYGRDYKTEIDPVHICYGARIAIGVLIHPGVTIGREAMVGMGSLVTKDCDPYWVYYGNPARRIRPVPESERL